jgi:DNA-binding XRE family transcriptional regulator
MNKKNAITLKELMSDITQEERESIETEKKYMQIVMTLRELRKTLGLTQEELAKKSKLPRTTISKVESGSRNTTLETLTAMAQAMGKRIELNLC